MAGDDENQSTLNYIIIRLGRVFNLKYLAKSTDIQSVPAKMLVCQYGAGTALDYIKGPISKDTKFLINQLGL